MANPETIAAWIEAREGNEQCWPDDIEVGTPLRPDQLVTALVKLHNHLNTLGPSEEWDTVRQWLFQYLAMYVRQISMEDKSREVAFRTPFIQASEPFTDAERRSIAEAQALKKQIEMQKKGLKASNVWW